MKIKAAIVCTFFAVVAAAAQVPAAKAPAKPAGKAAAPKFKAIWEPVPFNKDVDLNAVACVGPETCWAVGDKSTILFTNDGGTKWQVQLGGDPESTDDDLTKVFFLNAKNGWAMTDSGKHHGWKHVGGAVQGQRYLAGRVVPEPAERGRIREFAPGDATAQQ